MGYRLTDLELQDFQTAVKDPVFTSVGLDVWFTTTHDFLAEVLPPCFEVPDEPTGHVQFSTGEGAGMPYYSATVYVGAKFGDIDGWYDLTMVLSGDMNIILGRELLGESKKRARFGMTTDLPTVTAFAERGGTKIIQVAGEFDGPATTHTSVKNRLHLKAFLNHNATDIEYDPIVVVGKTTTEYKSYRVGTGSIELASTAGDPCGSVPIVSVDKAEFGERVALFETSQHRVDGKEGYLPYVLGRSYDLVE